jgi:hypothetical protein
MKYCKIIEDEVVEWGVSLVHITNRGHSVDDYTPVKASYRPSTLPWEYVVERKPIIENGEPVQNFEVLQYSIDQYKEIRLNDIRNLTKKALNTRFKLNTPLGFPIDADYISLTDFQAAKNLGLTFLRDANNETQTVTQSDWDVIITTIQGMGVQLKKNKWDLEDAIKVIEVNETYTTEKQALQAIFDVGIGMLKDLDPETPVSLQ